MGDGNQDDDLSDIPRSLKMELSAFGAQEFPIDDVRREAMFALHRIGWTMQRIGEAFGMSRQRVHQIIRSDGADGAAYVHQPSGHVSNSTS
jgi:hypothetical protein